MVADPVAGETAMARPIRATDWSATPLEAIETWPEALRTSLSTCLASLLTGGDLGFRAPPPPTTPMPRDGHSPRRSGAGCSEADDLPAVGGACWPDFWQGEEHAGALATIAEAKCGGTGRLQGFATTMKGSLRWWNVIVTISRDGEWRGGPGRQRRRRSGIWSTRL